MSHPGKVQVNTTTRQAGRQAGKVKLLFITHAQFGLELFLLFDLPEKEDFHSGDVHRNTNGNDNKGSVCAIPDTMLLVVF